MRLFRLFTTILVTTCLFGCATTSDTYTQYRHDPYTAAVADLVTTAVAVRNGAHELNPVGVNGVIVAKGIYLFGIRPSLDVAARAAYDRSASAIWYGAAVNNLVLILFPSAGVIAVVAGLGAGYTVYRD